MDRTPSDARAGIGCGECACSEAGEAAVAMLDAALEAIVAAETLDQAQGIAHAALHREEYHGHEQ